MPRSKTINQDSGAMLERGLTRQTGARRRRKVALACEACRLRKIRCDGVLPVCGTCRRRQGSGETCLYHNDNARTAVSKEYVNGLLDRIQTLERELGAEGGQADSRAYSEFQIQQQPFVYEELPERQGNLTSGGLQDACRTTCLNGPRNSVPMPSTAINPESRKQQTTAQETYPQNEAAYLVGSSKQPRNHAQITASVASQTNIAPQSDPMSAVHPQQAQSPSVSVGSQIVKVRDDSTEVDNPINAMGAASVITEGNLDSSDHFYGTSSAVSFSQQIYQTQQRISGRAEPSTHQVPIATGQPPQDMLSELLTTIRISNSDDYFLPPRVLADHLLDCYWTRVHCLYPFVHRQSFSSAYTRLWGSEVPDARRETRSKVGLGGSGCSISVFYCALNAMFALGCQFSDLPVTQRENLSDTFFRRSKQLLIIDVLDEGSLALIQTLLIVAQFLQSTQFPNRCWNVVGLACRMAQGLGLYLDNPINNRSFVEIEMRRRTWYGCITLDLVLSMTLGRPMSLSDAWPVKLPRAIDDEYMDIGSQMHEQPPHVFSFMSFYICTIKLYKILGSILTNVYNLYPALGNNRAATEQSENNPLDTLVKMDCALSNFESNIPSQLHWKRREGEEKSLISERQSNVLHARFLHLKIVLYRPIFTQLCRKSFPGSFSVTSRHPATSYKKQTSDDNPLYASFSRQCSITCVQAAQELIELISVTSQTAATGAWWYNIFYLFTSAMVITLAELCPAVLSTLEPSELDASWQKCQNTLKLMSSCNFAAQKCGEALNAMRQSPAPASSNLDVQGGNLNPDEPSAFLMETDPALPEVNEAGIYLPDQIGPSPSGTRSPADGHIHNNAQFDDAQLWDVLWQDTASVPTWNVEEWGWASEGMAG